MNRLLFPLLLSGCITLDALLPFHGNIPCTEVTQETCNVEDPWDAFCDVCEDYEPGPWWTRDYAWREITLDTISSIVRLKPTSSASRSPRKTANTSWTHGFFRPTEKRLHSRRPPSYSTTGEKAASSTTLHGSASSMSSATTCTSGTTEATEAAFLWILPREPGPPATPDWMTDARQAFLEAKELAPDAEKMIVYGMSVGGMPGGEMADVYDDVTCANMFEASFNSISSKVETNLALSIPGSHITSGLIENEVKLSDATTPTLIMHGTLDDRIHIDEAKTLYDALPEDLPKEWVVSEERVTAWAKRAESPNKVSAPTVRSSKLLEDKAQACLDS